MPPDLAVDTPSIRSARLRAAIAAGAAAAAVVVLVAWLALVEGGDAPPVGGAEAPLLVEVARAPAEPPKPVALLGEPVVARAAEPLEVEICGGEWVRLDAEGKPDEADLAAAAARLTEEAEGVALPAMAASADERLRAAAHHFRSGRERLLGAVQPECKDDQACRGRVEAWRQGWQAERDALVRIALVSSDARVYAWAYRACEDARSRSGDCQLVNASQWSRLDPGNAAPWLAVAAEAKERADVAAYDDAMFRVASATRNDSGFGVLAAAIAASLGPGEAHAVGALELAVQAAGIEGMAETAGLQEALQYCQAKDLVDPNRRETCAGMANVLATRSTSIAASVTGKGLGKRVGWPAERVAALDAEQDRLVKVRERESADAGPYECKAVLRALERLIDTGRVGQVEALRARAAPAAPSPYFAALPRAR